MSLNKRLDIALHVHAINAGTIKINNDRGKEHVMIIVDQLIVQITILLSSDQQIFNAHQVRLDHAIEET